MKIFFIVTKHLRGVSTDYRIHLCKNVIGINREKEICVPNKEYISGTVEKV